MEETEITTVKDEGQDGQVQVGPGADQSEDRLALQLASQTWGSPRNLSPPTTRWEGGSQDKGRARSS